MCSLCRKLTRISLQSIVACFLRCLFTHSYKPRRASHPRPECGAGASSLVGLGEGAKRDAPLNSAMFEVDDSDFTSDHREYLQEWANNLGESLEVLLGRIVIATCDGDLYIENAPEDGP